MDHDEHGKHERGNDAHGNAARAVVTTLIAAAVLVVSPLGAVIVSAGGATWTVFTMTRRHLDGVMTWLGLGTTEP